MNLTLDTDTWWGALLSASVLFLLASLPLAGWWLVNRIADRRPSLGRIRRGPRHLGLVLARSAAGLLTLGVLAFVVGFVGSSLSSSAADTPDGWAWLIIAGILVALGASVVGALGWALSQRAAWVFLALIVFLDVEIVLVDTLVAADEKDQANLVILLAFLTHAVCAAVTARWSFTARLHGPVEQAKAGEAGRSIAAVWVFLTAYTVISMVTSDEGIFGSSAGSAVTGALTLGALGATMGSGYTKYVEAMNAGGPLVDPATANRTPAPVRRSRSGTAPDPDSTEGAD